jgi:hypothetical protein
MLLPLVALVASVGFGQLPAPKPAASAKPTGPGPKPVASIQQLMEVFLIPSSDALFNVGAKEPKTDADWAEVKKQAILLGEGGHLLLVNGRVRSATWRKTATELTLAGAASLKAAEAKDVDKLIEVGDQILGACEGCHKLHLKK